MAVAVVQGRQAGTVCPGAGGGEAEGAGGLSMGMKGSVWGTCRDCGQRTWTRNQEWARAKSPRCSACGGILERSDDSWRKTVAHRTAVEDLGRHGPGAHKKFL